MSQYTVEHQTDKTCIDCEYYDYEIVHDSFGEMVTEYCVKGKYEHVGWSAEACDAFKVKNGEKT